MAFGITVAYDVTGRNYASVPPGQRCGYDTGSAGVAWTAAMWAANPGAVHIDQSPVNTPFDERSDVLDVEDGAATFADIAPWVNAAQANFASNARPGQRRPAVYCSASNVTGVVNALIASGITSGVGLWVAHFGVAESDAAAVVAAASGPFPVIGFQFSDTGGGGAYDLDVFSTTWLSTQSGVAGNTVAQGSSGPAVAAVQRRLGVWGYHVTQDGLFGQATKVALAAFQAARNLVADGIAGPATWPELDASPTPPPPPPPDPSPAPLDLRQSVVSSGAAATFSWGAVAGVKSYHLQVEWYKKGFGWVLSTDQAGIFELKHAVALAPRTKFRWRVSADTVSHVWPPWIEFTTS
jgi:hypothetical protein